MHHLQKYTPEEIQLVVTLVNDYRAAHNNAINWTELTQNNEALRTLLETKAKDIKYLRGIYYRNATDTSWRNKQPNQFTKAGGRFTEQDKAEIMSIAAKHDNGNGRIPWSQIGKAGVLNDLMAKGFTLEQIRNRYSYELKQAHKHKHKHKRAQQRPATSNIDENENEVIAARNAEVARQQQAHVTQIVVGASNRKIDYCPHCGLHIAGIILPA